MGEHKRATDVLNIDLGVRLNHLLNRNTWLGHNPNIGKTSDLMPGLVLPAIRHSNRSLPDTAISSGNVVISGDPGSGKSTLALQIAVAAAEAGCDSAYISLEEEIDLVRQKAAIFNWARYLFFPKTPATFSADWSFAVGQPVIPKPQEMRQLLETGRRESADGKKGMILLPGLLPRPLDRSESRLNDYFWQQYQQIEFLVRSAGGHNRLAKANLTDPTGVRLIVIDSLNMLSVEHRNREMMHRLFDLFRQNQIMGIFTVEGSSDIQFDSTMADVIFSFSRNPDFGYEVLFLECSKSRFSARTQGRHPYKIITPKDDDAKAAPGESGIVCYPSPHAVVAATEGRAEHQDSMYPFGWGDEITRHLLRSDLHRGNVVTLAGPNGTFKTQIALNFVAHGLASNESVLYLRLRTPEPLELSKSMMPYARIEQCTPEELHQLDLVTELRDAVVIADTLNSDLKRISSRTKVEIKTYAKRPQAPATATLIVADFKTGMLLAEEFIDTVRRIFDSRTSSKIRRVVLDDVGVIGASYPLLRKSHTTGDLFVSAFVHLMRNYGVDLLVVGTTGDFEQSNEMVHQACSLADAVLRTSIGVIFGDKQVLLTGDGMAGRRLDQGQIPPVVLAPEFDPRSKLQTLKPDPQLLDEFVGFDLGNIQRPGIILNLYQENSTHEDYNNGLAARLRERYGRPAQTSKREDLALAGKDIGGDAALVGTEIRTLSSGVEVFAFKPGDVARLDPSEVRSMRDRPRNHTAVRMIDEFENDANPAIGRELYMRNVLLLAYRTDVPGSSALEVCRSWAEIALELLKLPLPLDVGAGHENTETARSRRFCFDTAAPETLACLVLSAVTTGGGIRWNSRGPVSFPGSFEREIQSSIIREFDALHQLMSRCSWSDEERTRHSSRPTSGRHRDGQLAPDATLYVCWYSQLRELLNREPHLAPLLKVRPLPAEGFRGDWFLQVEPGSVSRRLGKAIVHCLRSPGEDFERFRKGVSLPIRDGQDPNPRLAWPGANKDVKLSDVLGIWLSAHQRSRLQNYGHFNRVLYGVGDVLAGKTIDINDPQARVDSEDLVERLPKLVADISQQWIDYLSAGSNLS